MGMGTFFKGLFGGGKSGKDKSKKAGFKAPTGPAVMKDPLLTMPKTDLDKRFELIVRTGQGSMSKVWKARDKKMGRVICLKVLDKEKTAKFNARFPGLYRPSEGFICSGLKHPNIVQTLEFGMSTKGEPFLVMELIEGQGLNFLIETKHPRLNGNRANFLIQTADSLDYLHKAGYLHRDICPRNIMVWDTGIVKLIDFGLTIPYTPDFCKPGNRTGTPNYLAPELIKRVTTDHRIDMFALGVTAYEVYSGQLPWEKTASLQTLLSHLNSAGKDVREYMPDIDDDLHSFLMKAIERDPAKRFQDAIQFREALKAIANQGL